MPPSGIVYQYFLIAPHVLLLPVLGAILYRRVYREFPIFCAYVLEEIVQSAVMIALIETPSTSVKSYSFAYLGMWAVSTSFRFGVVYEIFVYMLRNYAAVANFGKPLFRWAIVLLFSIAFGLTVYTGVYVQQAMVIGYVLDRATSVLQCGLLLTLFVFASKLALSWRSHAFGIALGMGIKASADLAASAVRSEIGPVHQIAINYFVMAAYHLCVLVWVFYLFAPEKSYAPKALPQHDLESWNVELERMLKQP